MGEEDVPVLRELERTCAVLNFQRSLTSEAEQMNGLVTLATDRSAKLLGRTAVTRAGCTAARTEAQRVRLAAQALRARAPR